jgi:23S rRNA pseudouridine1911/1915/1917 synthase
MSLKVLYEDNHLLVVDKPAGLLVQGDGSSSDTLLDVGRDYLRDKYDKPGNVYLGLVHRLDRNVSGVVLLARTSKAASRLSVQFREKSVTKTYLAVVSPAPAEAEGRLRHWLAAVGDRRGVTRAETAPFAGARESILDYQVLETADTRPGPSRALVRVQPLTGRRHQIRAQLALAGSPLLGDVKYGATAGLADHRLALHAWALVVRHPVKRETMEFRVDPPGDWPWAPHDKGARG